MAGDVAGRMRVDFLRHSSGVRRRENAPRPAVWTGGVWRGAFGAPSAGLSLVGLRPRRAQLRFTRRAESSHDVRKVQDQRAKTGEGSLSWQVHT
jgi:hypothetical protein